MTKKAKLFSIGGDQLVQLPRGFRFSGTHVLIWQDLITGNIVLSPRPSSWQAFFDLADSTPEAGDFLSDRVDLPAEEKRLF